MMVSFLSNDVAFLFNIIDQNDSKDTQFSKTQLQTKSFSSLLESYFKTLSKTPLESQNDFMSALTIVKPSFAAISDIDVEAWFKAGNKSNCTCHVHDWIQMICSKEPTQVVLAILDMTSHLERLLGDVFLTKGKTCPFLLRDLLASPELTEICLLWRMKVLQLLLGGPFSLNLRNLTWHGFVTPEEIPHGCAKILLVAVCELYSFLDDIIDFKNLKTRPLIHISAMTTILMENLNVKNVQNYNKQMQLLFVTSPFIQKSMHPYFMFGLDCYNKKQYYYCVMVLLPQLETLLRCQYARCNNMPDRMKTAQSSEFYTTMDEVLLLDLFDQLEGWRLRDRMSHGELDASGVNQYVADVILMVVTCACHRPIKLARAETDPSNFCPCTCICNDLEWLVELHAQIANYESIFHPLGVAKRLARECFRVCEQLEEFKRSSLPEEMGKPEVDQSLVASLVEARRKLLFSRFGKELGISDADDLNTIFATSKRIRTLYRTDSKIQEASNFLRQIVQNALNAAEHLLTVMRDKTTDLRAKKLRSRQRKTYQRLLCCCPVITSALTYHCCAVFVFIHQRFDVDTFTALRRDFRTLLRVSEKLVTFTSGKVNKWQEASAISSDLVPLFG